MAIKITISKQMVACDKKKFSYFSRITADRIQHLICLRSPFYQEN
jgi:hypothetical protein